MPAKTELVRGDDELRHLYAFLEEVRLSIEFRTVATRAAKQSGYDLDDELADEMLNKRTTLIIRQVMLELANDEFKGRTHHRRGLYNDGCHLPLCKKAERDRSRERYRRAHQINPRKYNKRSSLFDDQILEFIANKYELYVARRMNVT